ncbi:MAG: HYR domain-containing protein, partial [Cytophagales bacterium]
MKKSILLLLFFGVFVPLRAQFIMNNGAKINTTSSTFVRTGTLTNQTAGSETILNGGTVTLSGNLINNGIFTGGLSSMLSFEGSAMQFVQGGSLATAFNLSVNNAANHLTLQNSVRITNNLLLTNGRLFSETSPIYFSPTALNPAETNLNRIIGTAIMDTRAVGAAAFPTFLNAQLAAGGSIGNFTLTRRTGPQGIVAIGPNTGIACYWTFENTITASRDLTLSWLSDLDNAKDLTQLQRWRTNLYNTVALPWVAVSPLANLSARTHTQNEADLQHSWTYSDNVNPLRLINCPANQTAPINSACTHLKSGTDWNANILAAGTAVSYALSGATTGTLTTLNGAVFNVGVTTVTVTATLGAANQTCSFTVTINEPVPPSITCPATQTITLSAACTGTLGNYISLATVSDNCTATASIAVTQSPAAGTALSGAGTTIVTLTATDAAGNTANCTFNVNRVDNTLPTITCPANVATTVAAGTCGRTVTYAAPTASDNCSGGYARTVCAFAGLLPMSSPTVVADGTTIAGPVLSAPIPMPFPFLFNGVPVTNLYASSAGFLTADVSPGGPLFASSTALPAATPVNLMALCWTDLLASASYSVEGVAPNRQMIFRWQGSLGAAFNGQIVLFEGTNEIRMLTGATSYVLSAVTQGININATTAYTVPGFNGGVLLGARPASCQSFMPIPPSITVAQTAGLPSGATFPVGTTTNTFQVTDAAGNVSTCSFAVTIVDNQAPSIICPANITQNVTAGTCGRVVTYTAPVGTDNCSGAVTTQTAGLPSGATFPVGTTTNTFQVTDAAGNVSTCSFTVTIVDNQAPIITCPANITLTSSVPAVAAFAAATATDNCTAAPVITQTAGPISGSV